jgi:hypothetical protein
MHYKIFFLTFFLSLGYAKRKSSPRIRIVNAAKLLENFFTIPILCIDPSPRNIHIYKCNRCTQDVGKRDNLCRTGKIEAFPRRSDWINDTPLIWTTYIYAAQLRPAFIQ